MARSLASFLYQTAATTSITVMKTIPAPTTPPTAAAFVSDEAVVGDPALTGARVCCNRYGLVGRIDGTGTGMGVGRRDDTGNGTGVMLAIGGGVGCTVKTGVGDADGVKDGAGVVGDGVDWAGQNVKVDILMCRRWRR